MSHRITLGTIALLSIATACTDGRSPTSPSAGVPPEAEAATTSTVASGERIARERLARQFGLAMGNPAFRAQIKARLDRSPVHEHKLHFQRMLQAEGGAALRTVAGLSKASEANVEADAKHARSLELYFPVPEHRARWSGSSDLLVATGLEDGDVPVAFDVRGRRYLLSPTKPPATPVLALVPVETDFDHPIRQAPFICCANGPVAPPGGPGLYLTAAHFVRGFEGWLKGRPEYEIHILGQAGTSDSLASYQCAGEHASAPYSFDQNTLDWTGNVMLFSQTQLDSYKSQHPNQNFRVLALEDDDGACSIRLDNNRFKSLITTLQAQYPDLTGGKDSAIAGLGKIVKRANALQTILKAAYSFITSQDDLVGNAIEDVVASEFHPGANWIVKGPGNTTNGWLTLQVR